jgi:hypothetical protein
VFEGQYNKFFLVIEAHFVEKTHSGKGHSKETFLVWQSAQDNIEKKEIGQWSK